MGGGLCDKQTYMPTAIYYCTVDRQIVDRTPPVIDLKARHWSKITIFAYPICIRCCYLGGGWPIGIIAISLAMEKLLWCGYLTAKNF